MSAVGGEGHDHGFSMRPVEYPVCVVEQQGGRGYCFALLPDLECQDVGGSVDQAIAAVRGQALRRFAGWSGRREPPTPSRLSLASVELLLPAPASPAGSAGDLLVPDAAGGWSQRHDLVILDH
jgi:hypothetical protein